MAQYNIYGEIEHVPREELDQYFTDPRVVRAHLRRVLGPHVNEPRFAPSVLELGAGEGAYLEGLLEVLPKARITAVEADPVLVSMLRQKYPQVAVIESDLRNIKGGLAMMQPRWDGTYFDYCIGNPPYKNGLAEATVRGGIRYARITSLLLRIAFLSSADRVKLWRVAKITRMGILVPRPPFKSETGEGIMSDMALFDFERRKSLDHLQTHVELDWVEWRNA